MKNTLVESILLATLLLAFACRARAQTLPNPSTDLADTSWQLVQFEGGDGRRIVPDDKSKYTIAFARNGSVNARIDCNRGRGIWKSSGANHLEFGPLALTRAMCPPESIHDRIVKDWGFVRSYVIKDGHLFLSLMADGGIYEFEPIGGSKTASPKSPVSFKGPINYECESGGDKLKATFYETTPAMVLVERTNQTIPAFQVPAASGAKYEGEDILFWDKEGEAMVLWLGVQLKCKAR